MCVYVYVCVCVCACARVRARAQTLARACCVAINVTTLPCDLTWHATHHDVKTVLLTLVMHPRDAVRLTQHPV